MQIRVRVTSLTAEPSDTSGFLITAEVADAERFTNDLLRRDDDGERCWPLGKRYVEVCAARRVAEARVAELEAALQRFEKACVTRTETKAHCLICHTGACYSDPGPAPHLDRCPMTGDIREVRDALKKD